MPASVLIPPDNRLLGWSLSDLTLYGAPSGSAVTIGRAADGATPVASPAATPIGETEKAAAIPESDRAADDMTGLPDRGDAQPPQPSSATLSTSSVVPADHASTEAQPATPQPIGAGSFLQSPVITPLPTVSADHGGGGSSGGTASGALADGVTQPLASVAAVLPAGLSHLASDALQPLSAAASALPDAISHAADTLLTGHVAGLDPLGTVDTTLAHLGTAELIPPGADVAGLASGAFDAGGLSSFGGSDPAAGLQTLIGMVDSVDAFDLGHTSPAGAASAGAGSILDSLAADDAAPSLLGDHADAAHHALDDHGTHLGI